MNRFALVSLCLFIVTSSAVFAETFIETIVVDGYGTSRNSAVQSALIEALKQSEGVSIDSQRSYAKSIEEDAVSSADGEASYDVVIADRMQQKIKEATSGVIDHYRIVDSRKDGDGQWIVQVEVSLSKYKTPGISPNSLRKIAVIPFRTKKLSIAVLDEDFNMAEISRQLSQRIVTELTQSRRFTVLDRDYMTELLKERNLIISADATTAEQMKLGETLGVDYLVIGTITEFEATQTSNYIKILDETVYGEKAHINIDFRIMVMATGQIKWSDTVKVIADNKQLEKPLKERGEQGVVDFMVENAARKIVHSSLDNIYPIKILKVAGEKSIYLNQGGKMASVGDVFEVYTPGESIVDPDTGLGIKIDGEKVAMVEITKVQAKYSLAKLLSGRINEIEAGAILRKSSISPSQPDPNTRRVMQPAW